MGYLRQGMPQALDRAGIRAIVIPIVAQELAFTSRTIDPFGIAHDCLNPAGHDPIAACGEIVCCHCAKVFWR